MKKFLYVFLLCFVLTGCIEKDNDEISNLEGKYFFDDCVYLNFLSSSTKEFYTEQHSGVVYINFDQSSLDYLSTEDSFFQYNDIKFQNVSMNENLDEIINLDINNIFSNFESRFDIYNDKVYTGLSIFLNEECIYLAEVRIFGDNTKEYFIWTIFSLKKAT
ncbi:MAG: hypothetical protein JXQ26_11780 [Tissierellales bacterium]|nr:hypothetical protein [Tissierellales bacterium]